MTTAIENYVRQAYPQAVCVRGAISGKFRIYRNGEAHSSYIGTGTTQAAAWLRAAAAVAETKNRLRKEPRNGRV
jgi:hypothetical protein